MLNYIWLALILVAVIVAAVNGTPAQVTSGALDGAKTAVEIAIGLVGVMSLWLGIMKIAERAGLISLLSRGIAPLFRLIFPDVPSDHPAMGAMIMNIAANMLGLSNAATPLGIKAMEELQELNRGRDVASNAMVTFMCVNTAGLQFIPATAMAILAASGSKQPAAIISSTILTTSIGTVVAITASKVLQRFFPDRVAAEVEPLDVPPEVGA
jgi:spore maturation protein A